MITNWIDDLPFPLYGDGRQERDWLFVLDHVRALDLILRKGVLGEIYNIGGTHHCSNRELVESVRGVMGKPKALVRHVPDRPGHDRRYALNCDKLRGLGFKHAFSFDRALQSTVTWYFGNQYLWRPLKKRGGFRAYYRKQYAGRLKAGAA